MEALVRVYADEVEHTAVRCTLLSPGPMRTRMRMNAFPGEDPADLTPPEAIAPLVVELARADREPKMLVLYQEWVGRG
jgi:NAD(P)-dependent dehydrogenase (short-subunit alcohol dehydrogenase family)